MAFSVAEYKELVRLLEEHPDLRAGLRSLLFVDERDELRKALGELAAAQKRTEESLAVLTERVDQLAEAQRRTEQRLDQLAEAQRQTEQRLAALTERVDQLAEAQRRTEQRLDQLAEAQRQTEQGLLSLTAQVRLLTNEVAQVKGSVLEQRYRDRAPAYFAPLMRRIHALSSEELATLLEEAELSNALTESERQELLNTDVVVHGLWRLDGAESYLAVEVPGGVGAHDVERAAVRAALLSRITGKRAIPVVAGQAITDEGERAAKRLRAWCVLDGRCTGPSDALTSF